MRLEPLRVSAGLFGPSLALLGAGRLTPRDRMPVRPVINLDSSEETIYVARPAT